MRVVGKPVSLRIMVHTLCFDQLNESLFQPLYIYTCVVYCNVLLCFTLNSNTAVYSSQCTLVHGQTWGWLTCEAHTLLGTDTQLFIPAYVLLYMDKPAGDLLWTNPRVIWDRIFCNQSQARIFLCRPITGHCFGKISSINSPRIWTLLPKHSRPITGQHLSMKLYWWCHKTFVTNHESAYNERTSITDLCQPITGLNQSQGLKSARREGERDNQHEDSPWYFVPAAVKIEI